MTWIGVGCGRGDALGPEACHSALCHRDILHQTRVAQTCRASSGSHTEPSGIHLQILEGGDDLGGRQASVGEDSYQHHSQSPDLVISTPASSPLSQTFDL